MDDNIDTTTVEQTGDDTQTTQETTNVEVDDLFGDPIPTDDELMGVTRETTETDTETTTKPDELINDDSTDTNTDTTEDTEEKIDKADDDKKVDAEGEDIKAKEDVDKETDKETETKKREKPPAGYVEKEALFARNKRIEEIKEQNKVLQEELSNATTKLREMGVGNDFRRLTEAEFQELKSNDPEKAIDYMRQEAAYDKATQAQSLYTKYNDSIINKSLQEVQEVVPDLFYNENSTPEQKQKSIEVANRIINRANELGLDTETVNMLTNPKTMILPAGAQSPIPLGSSAVDMLKMLSRDKKPERNIDEEFKQKEEDLRNKIIKEVMAKFNKDERPDTKVGLGNVTTGGTQIPKKELSFDEMEKLSEKELAEYLKSS